jgi:hypothetical protein
MIKEYIKTFFEILMFKKNTGLGRNQEILFGVLIWVNLLNMLFNIIKEIMK